MARSIRTALFLCAAVAALLLALPAPVQSQYVGASRCRVCHLPQAKSWEATKMAKAFELLKPGAAAEAKKAHKLDPAKDYTNDATCLACHTTGYGQPGGFVSLEKTPNLVGIQCEACHGAGQEYLKPGKMTLQNKEYKRADLVAAGMMVPSEATCKKCHNEKSPFYQPFDYEARKKQGTHEHPPLKFAHE